MVDSVMKTSQSLIDYGWSRERAPVDTFIMALAASICERNDYDEQVIFLSMSLSSVLPITSSDSLCEPHLLFLHTFYFHPIVG